MATHADVLSRPEPLRISFWTSVGMHLAVIGSLLIGALHESNTFQMGAKDGGGFGSVMVNPVASIPIPNRGGQENPVANDTNSLLPTPPAKKEKPKPVVKPAVDEFKKIALQAEKLPKQPTKPQTPNKFSDSRDHALNQLTSDVGQRMSSPTFGVQGDGGLTLGTKSPLGDGKYAAYANLIRENISRSWDKTALNIRAGSPYVVITFTIHRDGSISNVAVGQSSGIPAMENSAKRAVMDARLPELPRDFPRSQADVELRFELGR